MLALKLAELQGSSADGSDGLRGLLRGLLGIPCDFRTQSQPMRVGAGDTLGARAYVDLLGSTSVGDEIVPEDVGPTPPELPVGGAQSVAYGLRERTLQITALSLSQTLDKSARSYLELLQNALPHDSTATSFAELGLAIVGASDIRVLDPAVFGRISSVAQIDLQVRYGTVHRDAPAPRINTAHVRATVDGRSALDLIAESS